MITNKINYYKFQFQFCSVSSAKGRVRKCRVGLQTKQLRFFQLKSIIDIICDHIIVEKNIISMYIHYTRINLLAFSINSFECRSHYSQGLLKYNRDFKPKDKIKSPRTLIYINIKSRDFIYLYQMYLQLLFLS